MRIHFFTAPFFAWDDCIKKMVLLTFTPHNKFESRDEG